MSPQSDDAADSEAAGQTGIPEWDAIETKALLSGLTEFTSRAGHDLVGPINQAGSLLALFIRRNRDQTGNEGEQLLDYLQSAASRMETVIGGVAEYMAVASARPDLRPVDLNHSLSAALAALDREIGQAGASIEADSLPLVLADSVQMAALFEILIGNSIKFRKTDTAPRIRVLYEPAGGLRTIAVRDNGLGIEPKFSENVFQPFRRLHGREYPGPGLGLARAKLIVERHGGSIQALCEPESLPGFDGACLRFTLLPAGPRSR